MRRSSGESVVSVMGGFPGNGPIGNVSAIVDIVPIQLPCQLIGRLLRLGDSLAEGGGAKHPAAVAEHIIAFQPGAGVEYLAVAAGVCRQPADPVALGVAVRVTA